MDRAYRNLRRSYDQTYGGFGQAPKFPTPHLLSFLLRYGVLKGEELALEMVVKTLDGMYRGGIYDHIGGGFSRYSTDDKWLVPHFEKMLYDNALLLIVYTEAYQILGREEHRTVVEEVFGYLLRDMVSAEGGFYSAEDADSDSVEGKFYVWNRGDIIETLGEKNGRDFCELFDITESGNFEGRSIPNLIRTPLERIKARKHALAVDRQKLLRTRDGRVHPYKDDKILTSWNGLMIAALAERLHHTVAIGVGGSFEIITGLKREAPGYIRQSGLEWAYRIVQDPRRINRIPQLIRFWYHYLR
jgi:uncharacterized protein YyaL (SSP411 family)